MNRSTCMLVVFTIVALSFVSAAVAQTSFTEVTPTTGTLWVTGADEDFWINSVAPADVDGDGDLDLAVLGFYVVYFGEGERPARDLHEPRPRCERALGVRGGDRSTGVDRGVSTVGTSSGRDRRPAERRACVA